MSKMNWDRVRQENLVRSKGFEPLVRSKPGPVPCAGLRVNGKPCGGFAKKGFDLCGPHLATLEMYGQQLDLLDV